MSGKGSVFILKQLFKIVDRTQLSNKKCIGTTDTYQRNQEELFCLMKAAGVGQESHPSVDCVMEKKNRDFTFQIR